MNTEKKLLNTQKTPLVDTLYMLALVSLPILSRYQVGPLDLDVVAILAFFVLFLFSSKYVTITPLGKPIVAIILYILVVAGVNLLFGEQYSSRADIILRMGRYCIYLFVVFCLGNKHVNYEDTMRLYRGLAYAATIYIILQTIVYYSTGMVLPSKIGASIKEASSEIGRLRSFYSEPAAMAYSLTPFIACSLFGGEYKKNKRFDNTIDALVVTVGIILSTSGQGIFTAAMLWGLWVLYRLKKGMKAKEALLILLAIVAVMILYASGILEYALGRAEDTGEGSAMDARYSGYVTLGLLSPLELMFGTGFGNYVVENVFNLEVYYKVVNYSSIAEFLFTLGIFGTAFWVCIFLYLYKKGTVCSKVLILALTMMALLGCPMTGVLFPMWLTLICTQLPKGIFTPEKQSNNY